MNRIDNTHATFINCLRDWNDPFLHGHKPVKALGCQRCENSNCRYTNNNNTSANSVNTSNNYSSSSSITSSNQVNSTNNNNDDHSEVSHDKHYLNDTFSKLNKNLNLFLSHQNHHHHKNQNNGNHRTTNLNTGNESSTSSFQPIVRCKSSINVPKTIDQCIKLARSRPRPSSIRPFSKTRKQPIHNSDIHLKTKVGLITKSSSDLIVKGQKLSPVKTKAKESKLLSNSKAISTDECDTTLFEIIANDSKFQTFNFSMKDLVDDFENKNLKEKLIQSNKYFGHERDEEENEFEFEETSENLNNNHDNNKMMDTISLLSCSSSIIENDEINYDDSLQDNSFDSDR